MPTMRIRPTDEMVNVNGVMAQKWEGYTDVDQLCEVFVLSIRGETEKDTQNIAEHFGLSGEMKEEGDSE